VLQGVYYLQSQKKPHRRNEVKFKINLIVTSEKGGLELDSEYDRLNVAEKHRAETLKFFRGINVDKVWAKGHRELFGQTCVASLRVDSSAILPEDLEEWGTMGVILADLGYDRLDALVAA